MSKVIPRCCQFFRASDPLADPRTHLFHHLRTVAHHLISGPYTPSINPLLTNGTNNRSNAFVVPRGSSREASISAPAAFTEDVHSRGRATALLTPTVAAHLKLVLQGAHWRVPRQGDTRPALAGACEVHPPSFPNSRMSLSAVVQARPSLPPVCMRTLPRPLENFPDTRVHTFAPRIDVFLHVSHPRIRRGQPTLFTFGTCEGDVEWVEAPGRGSDELNSRKDAHPTQDADDLLGVTPTNTHIGEYGELRKSCSFDLMNARGRDRRGDRRTGWI